MHAYNRHLKGERVEIMFYFNEFPSKTADLDLEQVAKVRDFKSKVAELGGLYWSYSGHEEFEKKLTQHLSDYFIKELGTKAQNPEIIKESERLQKIARKDAISLILKNRLNDALSLFSNQPIVWVDPVLSTTNKISSDFDDNDETRVSADELIDDPKSLLIKAPPQFGLTSLANYLVLKAWEKESVWIYLDAEKLHRQEIDKAVSKELRNLDLEGSEIGCIILDSWNASEPGSKKLLKNLASKYKNTPIIVMQTIDDARFQTEEPNENIGRAFGVLHLLALPRHKIRTVVSSYNIEKNIGDDDVILEKMTRDLDVLNIHRTPLNCLTLLRVSEINFDESPVNRTKMIEMVLYVLFDLGQFPTYTTKPDLKDCEYILGMFCENMIRKGEYVFSIEGFINETTEFCKKKLLSLDVRTVFDVLTSNTIIVKRDGLYAFRSSYWIYYFSAKRMHISKEFYNYVMFEKGYTSFPEIIEFFTGIDRNRDDVLTILRGDLIDACDTVEKKTGLPKDINPFRRATWTPSEEALAQMKEEISDNVKASNLPDVIKDQYADRGYNQLKPYDQSISEILEQYSLAILIRRIKSSSRALRNSDYVDPAIKKELLSGITRGWELVSKILFALAPLLAHKGYASIEGQGFVLLGDFPGKTIEEKINNIIQVNPNNIVGFFKDDLFSSKIGPLLYDNFQNEPNDLTKHHLALLLIHERPQGWKAYIEDYIASIDKNSFYLYDVVHTLRAQYRYSFAPDDKLHEIVYLLKLGFAKHEFGGNKPGLDKIKRISNSVVPKRLSEEKKKENG